MNTCGIVTLSSASESNAFHEFLCRRSPTTFLNTLVKLFGKNRYEVFELPEIDLQVYAVKISFTYDQINSFRESAVMKIFNIVANWFDMHSVKNLILPKELYTNPLTVKCFENFNYGKYNKKSLLMALTMDILKNISKTKGVDLSSRDMVVVDSDFSDKAVHMIEMLSSSAKCVFVITQNTKKAQRYAEEQFDENGLVVHVSGNLYTVSDLNAVYFVMDSISEVINKCSLGKSKIIFNYSPHNSGSGNESQVIIDGLFISLPEALKKVNEYVDRSNIESFIESVIVNSTYEYKSGVGSGIYENYKNDFYRLGCRITALHNPSILTVSQKSNNFVDNRQTVVYNK